MKWVEIITLRSLAKVDRQLLDELLQQVVKSKTDGHPIEIRMYQNSIVETDLSIHIYWESESGSQNKSPLGLRFSYALKGLGLLNHSVWVETAALEFPLSYGNTRSRDILESDRKDISKRFTKQRRKIMKLIVIIAAGLLMMTLPACSSSKTAEQAVSAPIPVKIGKAHPIEDHEGVALSGTVGSPAAPSNVSFLVSGKVMQVSPREGDYVRKGQLLASIDPTDYQLALTMATKQADMARIAFERAEDEHRRMKMLYDSKSLAPNDYEKYKSAYESARQQYEQAMASEKISRKHLTDAELHSPVNGFISKRSIEPGETASPGRPVFEIVNLDTVEISVGVPETDVHSVRVGQKAAITLPALPGESFEGVVRIVNISADPGTRTFMTRITIPNPKHTLRIGMVAEARIRGDKVVKMLTAPIEAIVRDPQGATLVYVYYPDQKRVYAKRVEIGAPREKDLEIRSGLTGDEWIVLAGQTKLRDGSVVSTAEATERPEVNSEGGVRK